MSTQKAITSEVFNATGEKVEMRICSIPEEQTADIYSNVELQTDTVPENQNL